MARSTAYSNVSPEGAVEGYYGLCTNYEIIELTEDVLSKYGAGYYELYIYRTGESSKYNIPIGMAWEQW